MDGLIIKTEWINKILDDNKIWEIRSKNTTKRGRIALIESGTKTVVGIANLIDSFPVDTLVLNNNKDKHFIEDLSIVNYKKPHAWVIENAVRLKEPIPYTHPQGAVIWVQLIDFEQKLLKL